MSAASRPPRWWNARSTSWPPSLGWILSTCAAATCCRPTPTRTAAGARYDSGDLPRALAAATSQVDYDEVRREQRRRRDAGTTPLLGVGIGAYVNVTGWESEFAAIEVTGDGRVTVTTGTAATGQQHVHAWLRLVERTLGIDAGRISVAPLDTAVVARGRGTWGSRSLQTAGSALLQAAAAVRDRAIDVAARHWQVDGGDVALQPDGAVRTGRRTATLSWAQLAELAGDHPLRAAVDFGQDELTAAFGVHVAVVEVDADTGGVRIVRFVAVDDCGRVLVPAIVDGQVHGGVVQGIGEALYEGIVYDASGTPMTATLRSYSIPGARDLPTVETVRSQVPATGNPLGAKGVGESGVVGAVAALRNAVVDAVSHRGVTHLDVPLTPQRIWRALHPSDERRASGRSRHRVAMD